MSKGKRLTLKVLVSFIAFTLLISGLPSKSIVYSAEEETPNARVVAWGDNDYGQCNIPEGLNGVKQIAAGYVNAAALKEDGTVVVWGGNYYGQCNVPEDLNGVKQIAIGEVYIAALKEDGTVVVWGDNEHGQCNVPEGLKGVKQISAGSTFMVALKEDGTVTAWGKNAFGECEVPTGLKGVNQIAAGTFHTAALMEDGTVVVWGANYHGQCTMPEGLKKVKQVAVEYQCTAALKDDGTVVEWGGYLTDGGFFSDGNYNDNYNNKISIVPEGLTGVRQIASGNYHTAALKKDGTIVVWGGQHWERSDVPEDLVGIKQIAAGRDFTVALVSNAKPVYVTVNGNELTFDADPIVFEGRTLVPLRAIFESLGLKVGWDPETQTVTGTKEGKSILLKIDNDYAKVDNKEVKLDVPAKVMNDRTMVPARFIAESIGANVEWDENTNTVKIAMAVNVPVGAYIEFGQYLGEPILWRVINKNEDGSSMLLSEKIICLKPFDAFGDTTEGRDDIEASDGREDTNGSRIASGSSYWEKSNIREWLNSDKQSVTYSHQAPDKAHVFSGYNNYEAEEGFLYNFTSHERDAIYPYSHKFLLSDSDVTVKNGGKEVYRFDKDFTKTGKFNDNYDKAYYKNITDKVFLLDAKDLYEFVYKRGWEINRKLTAEAVDHSEWKSIANGDSINYNTYWRMWTMTPMGGTIIADVLSRGAISYAPASHGYIGVCPALNLKADVLITSGTGTLKNPFIIGGAYNYGN